MTTSIFKEASRLEAKYYILGMVSAHSVKLYSESRWNSTAEKRKKEYVFKLAAFMDPLIELAAEEYGLTENDTTVLRTWLLDHLPEYEELDVFDSLMDC